MKVLVCGDRDWTDPEPIRRELSKLPPDSVVVHGDCFGADSTADEIARSLGFKVTPVPADWDRYGNAAGPVRNRQMLYENPDVELVLAFHTDISKSKGTKDMLKVAREAGVPFEVFKD